MRDLEKIIVEAFGKTPLAKWDSTTTGAKRTLMNSSLAGRTHSLKTPTGINIDYFHFYLKQSKLTNFITRLLIRKTI
jgi:hypothetical protein